MEAHHIPRVDCPHCGRAGPGDFSAYTAHKEIETGRKILYTVLNENITERGALLWKN